MRKRLFLLVLLTVASLGTFAQQIVDVHQENDKIIIVYDLKQPADFVRVYVS